MKHINAKQTSKVILFIGYLFCLYLAFLYFFQNDLLFSPDKQYKSPQNLSLPFREEKILGSENIAVMNWYYPGDKNKPAVLFFHGNAGQIADFAPALMPIIKAGYPVLAMEYRGFGNTKGTISQSTLFQDAANAYDFLESKGHTHIVAYGYSFGCAFAAGLTSLRPVDGLILTAPFFSLKEIVSEKPVPLGKFLLRDSYPSYQYIRDYKGPVLIIHGKRDNLIPYHHSQDLYNQSQSAKKQLQFLDNDNHISLFWKQKNIPFILDFLKDLQKGL